jgi:hypothetical protein
MESDVKRYRIKLVDCAVIVDEHDVVDWFSLFSGRAFYEMVWSCFERHVPTRYSGFEQKLPRMTKELTSLKNNKARASKKSKDRKNRCLKDDAIDNCECERLREKYISLREEYQQQHGRAYDDYHAKIREAIKSNPKTFFLKGRLKKKRVGFQLVMHFEGHLALAPRKSVISLQNLNNEYIPMMSGCLLILAQNTFRLTLFLARSVHFG